MFIGSALIFLTATLTLLVMMRIQLIVPDNSFMRPQIFDRLLSAYGVSAVLLFAMPLLMGLISYIVPLQIGARGTALPRIGALSFWLFLAGGVFLYASFLWKPGEGGTAALPPLSVIATPNNGVNAWAAAVGLICVSMILFGVNMVTTVRRDRAPGMVWRRLPMFSFAGTVVSWTMLVIGPIMAAAVTMLLIDRNFGGVFFDSGEQGAPLLYEHLAWIFFTGIYVTLIVGAIGTITEIFSTFSGQPVFGHRTVAGSIVAFTVLGILSWMQNMYSAPIRDGFLYATMLLAVMAAVPIGLVVFNWIGTLRGGDVQMKQPMSFALGAAVLLIIGLAGEWAQSVIPVSWQVANTGVAWGDTHFALLGAGLLGGFAGLYYWFPKLCGRYLGESLGRGSLRLIVGGAVLMVIPMQLAGLQGMPVDVYKYYADTGMSVENLIASIGAFALAIGIILTLINVASSWNGGTPAGPDPWYGSTLEWFAPSPHRSTTSTSSRTCGAARPTATSARRSVATAPRSCCPTRRSPSPRPSRSRSAPEVWQSPPSPPRALPMRRPPMSPRPSRPRATPRRPASRARLPKGTNRARVTAR